MLSLMTFLRTGTIEEKATTQRINFPFNSFCNFNGQFLAAGPQGLCKLGNDTDNGQPINACFSPIQTDFGSSASKRNRYAYVSYYSANPLSIQVSADDGPYIPYNITGSLVKIQRVKIKLGEGTRGVFWIYRFLNTGGAYFALNRVEIEQIVKQYGSKNT